MTNNLYRMRPEGVQRAMVKPSGINTNNQKQFTHIVVIENLILKW